MCYPGNRAAGASFVSPALDRGPEETVFLGVDSWGELTPQMISEVP